MVREQSYARPAPTAPTAPTCLTHRFAAPDPSGRSQRQPSSPAATRPPEGGRTTTGGPRRFDDELVAATADLYLDALGNVWQYRNVPERHRPAVEARSAERKALARTGGGAPPRPPTVTAAGGGWRPRFRWLVSGSTTPRRISVLLGVGAALGTGISVLLFMIHLP